MSKVTATSAISRLGLRFGERKRRSEDGENPALTSTDEGNIQDFSLLVQSAMDLLEIENEALLVGDARRVSACYEEKSRILRDLTFKQPVVEPFLRDETPEILALRAMIRDFAGLLQRNGELLEGMANASRTILAEVENIRKRQSLDGLYDKSGQRVKVPTQASGKVISNL